jgi:hypothetical protein
MAKKRRRKEMNDKNPRKFMMRTGGRISAIPGDKIIDVVIDKRDAATSGAQHLIAGIGYLGDAFILNDDDAMARVVAALRVAVEKEEEFIRIHKEARKVSASDMSKLQGADSGQVAKKTAVSERRKKT